MKHILLLEDHIGVAELLLRLLEEEKYYVSYATRILDALSVLEKVKVDLLVADMLLPDGNAFGLIDVAKRRHVPYLLMTGSPDRMAELEANGEFHLSKPFKIGTFIARVRERIGPANGEGRN